MDKRYRIYLYTGALKDPSCIENLPKKVIKRADNSDWIEQVELLAKLEDIKKIQQELVKHYQGPEPWFLYGENFYEPTEVIVAFGADDGEGGEVFIFNRNDFAKYQEVVDYGMSKGIPIEEMDFLGLIWERMKHA